MSSKIARFALIGTAPRDAHSVDESKTPSAPMPAGVAPRPLSKGPPPLPKLAVPTEPLLFEEGVDGHAESVPPSGRYPFPLERTVPVVGGEAETKPSDSRLPAMSLDDEWLEAEDGEQVEWLEVEEEVEDPARARRRKVAQIGTAWGMVMVLAMAGTAAFMRPRGDVRAAALSTSPATVETVVAHAPAATPGVATPANQGPQPSPLATNSTAPAVHTTTASSHAAASASPRAAARASSPSHPTTRPGSTSPRVSGARGTRARHPQTVHPVAAAKPSSH